MTNSGTEQWTSRTGFILATIGSAAGIGNIWRFSYVAGENGGGAFLLLYLLCVLLIGLPVLMAELAMGRIVGGLSASAATALRSMRAWRAFRWLTVSVAFLILSYYAVIAGWALKYFVSAADGSLLAGHEVSFVAFFDVFVADPLEPVMWQGLMLAGTVFIVAGGVRNGIEAANRYLMPALFAITIGLALYALTLDGAARGLEFLFSPDWSAFGRPEVYLAAVGQALFSLGIGAGIFVTYGSYLKREHNVPTSACAIVLGDTLIAVLAGVAVFSTVFAFGLDPAAGPELAFITLPKIFEHMTYGRFVATAFFALLVVGALTSMVSILEVPVAWSLRRSTLTRRTLAIAWGGAVFVVGVPSALGFGVLKAVTLGGEGILDAIDFFASNLLLPVGGILAAILVGWRLAPVTAVTMAGLEGSRAAGLWLVLIRWLAPMLLPAILVHALIAG